MTPNYRNLIKCFTILRYYNDINVMSLKDESRRRIFHFGEIFEKCIEYVGKFLIHFRENFCYKSDTF